MKVVVEDRHDEGFDAFLNKDVSLWCLNYIYSGKLVGINDTCLKLENAKIVYETGAFTEKGWKDAQRLPEGTHYVQISAIESFGPVK